MLGLSWGNSNESPQFNTLEFATRILWFLDKNIIQDNHIDRHKNKKCI